MKKENKKYAYCSNGAGYYGVRNQCRVARDAEGNIVSFIPGRSTVKS